MEDLGTLLWKTLLCLIVLNKCQDRRTCRLVASAEQFGGDPCPGTSKYLEVAYRCRPNEFRSRITCEDENLILKCKKSQRIAIYSAKFGRSRRGNLECPAEAGMDRECEAACSVKTVMRMCHGKRRCTVPASSDTFGNPCDRGVKKYLSVIYTCVPKRILKEIRNNEDGYPNTFCNIETPPESPETETPSDGIPPTRRTGKKTTTTTTQPSKIVIKGDEGNAPDFSTYKYEIITSTRQPPHKDQGGQSEKDSAEVETTDPYVTPESEGEVSAVKDDYVGFVTDWIYTYSFIKDNLEKFILYVILGLFLGLILLLITIIVRMAQTKRTKKRRAKLNISEPVPNSSGQTEDLELLSDSDRTDGIEILSINHNNRPPPFRTDTGNRSMNSSYYG